MFWPHMQSVEHNFLQNEEDARLVLYSRQRKSSTVNGVLLTDFCTNPLR